METRIGIQADHSNMVKLDVVHAPPYTLIQPVLKEILDEAQRGIPARIEVGL
jgi:hypothetical protein